MTRATLWHWDAEITPANAEPESAPDVRWTGRARITRAVNRLGDGVGGD
jgi:hypothetical protein